MARLRATTMRSLQTGTTTHPVSVGAMSPRGCWLLLGEQKLFLAFAQFPGFRERRQLGDPAAVVARLRLERDAAPRRTARIG